MAKLLKYPIIEMHTDQQKMTKRVIALITVVIIAPSIYLAYNLVRKTVYQDNVNRLWRPNSISRFAGAAQGGGR